MTNVLERRGRDTRIVHMQRKGDVYMAKRRQLSACQVERSQEKSNCGCLDLRLPASKTVRK